MRKHFAPCKVLFSCPIFNPRPPHGGRQCPCVALPIIDVNKIGMQPKEGNFETVGESIDKLEGAKTFADLRKYWKNKYDMNVGETIDNLKFEQTKEAMLEIEDLIKEFPVVADELRVLKTKTSGFMSTTYSDMIPMSINFAPGYFNGRWG